MSRRRASIRRVFLMYALVSLIPTLILGGVLWVLTAHQSTSRGLQQAREAAIQTSGLTVSPLLYGHELSLGLNDEEKSDLKISVAAAVRGGDVVRLRLRDLTGKIVFASDDSEADAVDDDALKAAQTGETLVEVTHLNADDDHDGVAETLGPQVVEAYTPLYAESTGQRIGVLELYLPYTQIHADEAHDRHQVLLTLGIGLAVLWLVLLGVSFSVTRRLNRQTELANRFARTDPLTGLPNRGVFTSTIEELMEESTQPFVVGFLDIQGMQAVNENLGYEAGDELINAVAGRLRVALPEDSHLARAGGDKFGFLLDGDGANLAAVREAVSRPLTLAGLPFAVQAGVGYAAWPGEEPVDAMTLMSKADLATEAARRTRSGVQGWSPELDRRDADALRLIGELGQAIADGQLVLHLQPKANARTGALTGVEALVRWQHPTRGLLFPDAFLEAAEKTELIDDLTRWVLRSACRSIAQLPADLSVAVNISAATLIRKDFAAEVLAALQETNTPATRVILEITETALIADPQRAAETLGLLDKAGVRVSVDDFGAGQTSLSYLAGLPLAELKVDKSFVMAMSVDRRNRAIVSSVIQLGHALGLVVVAEGVEDENTWEQLEDLGCDIVQGYHLARPKPLAELQALLPSFGPRHPVGV